MKEVFGWTIKGTYLFSEICGLTHQQSGPSSDWGVNYRALHDLFNMTQSRLGVFRYEIDVQMLEIYNEQVRDLLIMDGTQKKYPLETDLPFLELFVKSSTQEWTTVCFSSPHVTMQLAVEF